MIARAPWKPVNPSDYLSRAALSSGLVSELPAVVYDGAAPAPVHDGDMQDGMLAYYLSQAAQSDANVENRLDSEPFDFRDSMTTPPAKQ